MSCPPKRYMEHAIEILSPVQPPRTLMVCSRITMWCWHNHRECWPGVPYNPQEIPPQVCLTRMRSLGIL